MEKNILALDLGKGSLGMAISRSGMFVTLLDNLRFPAGQYEYAIKGVEKVLERETVEHIVIGLPLFPSGDPCEMTPIVESFIIMLSERFPGKMNAIAPWRQAPCSMTKAKTPRSNGRTSIPRRQGLFCGATSPLLGN